MQKRDLTPKIARWALLLEEFECEVIHRPNQQMRHVEALSRNAVCMVTRSQSEITRKIATSGGLGLKIAEKETIHEEAKVNIFKVQEQNRRQCNRRRRASPVYNINDLVAIKRTQLGGGLKLKPKFLGPYKVVKIKLHVRYYVEKVGSHEGPAATSTSAAHMKPWSDAVAT
ncbi:hypothetical protein AVEN_124881-1 [Araneus ventricosus]|uniref:Reverse transcriptase RNase H-like domain-containing protein n=1 Tax=Araneus ventricosus TaxID=182803 RepID=A0A4Y2TTN0_ARAVE|nr:hypothetical protein AVEN_124881-1 [Araneus ventricosus]